MISRSTLIGALVVVELGIIGLAARAVAGDDAPSMSPFGFPGGPNFGMSAPSSPAFTKPLEKTFASGPAPHVFVDVHDVDVVVHAAATTAVRVVETVQRSGYVRGEFSRVSAEATPDGVRVASSGGGGVHVMIGNVSHELRLVVPAGAQVEIVSGARVDAQGLRSKFIAHVEEGLIRVTNHRGDVDLSTGDGRIYLTDVQGSDIAATTRSGRLYFTRVGADRIDAHTNFGRIYATDIRAVDGALTTKDGRIAVSLAANSDATVLATVTDGDSISVSGLPSTSEGELRRTIRLGSGRGRFEIATDNDSISVTQGANV